MGPLIFMHEIFSQFQDLSTLICRDIDACQNLYVAFKILPFHSKLLRSSHSSGLKYSFYRVQTRLFAILHNSWIKY